MATRASQSSTRSLSEPDTLGLAVVFTKVPLEQSVLLSARMSPTLTRTVAERVAPPAEV